MAQLKIIVLVDVPDEAAAIAETAKVEAQYPLPARVMGFYEGRTDTLGVREAEAAAAVRAANEAILAQAAEIAVEVEAVQLPAGTER